MDIFPGAILRQLLEWGYPQGHLRLTPPAAKAFSVIHITGNSRLPSADSELSWRINDTANQNSATFFVNRDGSVRQALGDPLRMAPWANGDLARPDTTNDRIRAMVDEGINANLRTIVAIENVGFEGSGLSAPITDAQARSNGRIIAHYHRAAGVPINRETVIGHYQINSVNRPNCPGIDKRVIDRIVGYALEAISPLPDTSTEEEDPAVIEDLRQQLWRANQSLANTVERFQAVRAQRDVLLLELDEAEAELADLTARLGEKSEALARTRERITRIKTMVAALAADVDAQ